MEEQKLCENCIQYLKEKYGDNFYVTPFSHCHHLEPQCWWCLDWKKFENESRGFPIYEVVKKLIGLSPDDPKCPICSARL